MEIFDKHSANKSDPKRTRKGGKCAPSCQFGLKYQFTVEKLEQIAMLILMKNDQILQLYNYETAPHFFSINPKLDIGLFVDLAEFTWFYQFLHDVIIKLFRRSK